MPEPHRPGQHHHPHHHGHHGHHHHQYQHREDAAAKIQILKWEIIGKRAKQGDILRGMGKIPPDLKVRESTELNRVVF